jgi:hypothetical protein
MQYLVEWAGRTKVIEVEEGLHEVHDLIKEALCDREGLSWEDFRLVYGNKELAVCEGPIPCAPAVIRAMMGLQGGKGGFGAMLRAQAKGKGAKQTTDFGACRDLQGRRLRHVNDEIRIQKWAGTWYLHGFD